MIDPVLMALFVRAYNAGREAEWLHRPEPGPAAGSPPAVAGDVLPFRLAKVVADAETARLVAPPF